MPNEKITPTHTGIAQKNGRRVPILLDPVSGLYLTRSEYRAIQAGCTHEWDTYTDIKPI